MDKKLEELKNRLREVNDLSAAISVLDWDQATYMPPGGAPARARQTATLSRLAHEKFTDDAVGCLLEDLRACEDELDYDSDEASLVRVARREYEKAVCVPPEFMAELTRHGSDAYEVWTKARPANDFSAVLANLQKTVDLSRQLADFFPGYEHVADPLIDFADHGMKASTVRALFSSLRQQIVPLVQAITSKPLVDVSCLEQVFPVSKQLAFGEEVARLIGYDFERGRQDETPHPFMTKFSLGDVRITTRVQERNLGEALFSTIHEVGHAMYEQGISSELDGTPLGDGTSAGVHESQSRLWENLVGRSRPFWGFLYPRLQKVFSDELGEITLDEFYRAINKVERSLIRTDADEVTYNLHVMIRFELELALLEGSLSAAELPDAWNERYREDLGIEPKDDKDGVLQDVHWYAGVIGGAFQGYTLGNILAAQLYEAALKAQPQIPAQVGKGEFKPLGDWLRDQVYRHGAKFTAPELIDRVVGSLDTQPLVAYLERKFGELYEL